MNRIQLHHVLQPLVLVWLAQSGIAADSGFRTVDLKPS